MRKKIVAGNWKMNLLADEALKLTQEIEEKYPSGNVQLILFPPALFVADLKKQNGKSDIGVQNFYPLESGAFTGEISIAQIADLGVKYVLVGHSERRSIFGEKAHLLKEKIDAALKYNICPVFCCGEPLEIREGSTELEFVKQQLIDGIFHLTNEQIVKCVIAYEPVWAIGTGKTATFDQAQEMHKAIRSWVSEQYNQEIADSISILYGGSCNASNAAELFACPDVDGGLIGGASLKADSFLSIAASF